MSGKRALERLLASAFVLLAAFPALAQKSQDRLRIAINEFVPGINPYELTLDELSRVYRQVYRPLLSRDERGNRWVPELAVSWTRVDDTTYDFQLREDVTFHSGNPFTADDVVYTGNYVIDPKTRIPGKARFSFLKSVEKLGPYAVRFKTNGVIGTTLESIAYDIYILDSKEHAKHAEAGSYGRLSASSAGHYRLVSMDPTKGALLERFENFKGTRPITARRSNRSKSSPCRTGRPRSPK